MRDQRCIGGSLGSATGGVPQNDRAFDSLSIATQSAEYTTCAKTSPLKKPLPQVAPRSANGLLAAISPADLPAVFSFCTRSRAKTSMSRNLVRSALLPSGPCLLDTARTQWNPDTKRFEPIRPGTIRLLGSAFGFCFKSLPRRLTTNGSQTFGC
jgi:hypothetical protein